MQENDAPPPCSDPNGTPAWQRALELGAQVNLPRRRERQRIASANRDEAIRRGHRDAAALAGHQAHEAGQAARRDHRLLYRRAVRERQRQSCARPRQRRGAPIRPPGSRRTSSSSRSAGTDPGADDGDDSDPEPPRRGPAARPRFSRPWRAADGQLAERTATLDGLGVVR